MVDERPPSSANAEIAFTTARNWILAGRSFQLQDLAAELQVSRSTLFRWVGNRDQLLGEIMWSLAEPTFAAEVRRSHSAGVSRVAEIIGGFSAALIGARFFRTFLVREPERALRILTTSSGVVQPRITAAVEELLVSSVTRDHLILPLPPPDLAYIVVRIAESFIYTDLITGDAPDADKAEAAIRALLATHPQPCCPTGTHAARAMPGLAPAAGDRPG